MKEIKGENERYKRDILREERGLLTLGDPKKGKEEKPERKVGLQARKP